MENNESKIFDCLNAVQKEAVECVDGPVLIVAGAGSGKTRVLTSRIAYLVQSGIDPGRILALTFTKKAAGEMMERIRSMIGGKARRIYMGTFHSVFIKFLREYAQNTQFILVTHRKGTMEAADVMYGVTIEDAGVSKLISVRLEDYTERG